MKELDQIKRTVEAEIAGLAEDGVTVQYVGMRQERTKADPHTGQLRMCFKVFLDPVKPPKKKPRPVVLLNTTEPSDDLLRRDETAPGDAGPGNLD